MPDTLVTETPLSDRDLVLQFESLGDNCELGLVQRAVGAEPLGLFRFAGAPLRHLIRAMEARFVGMDEPGHVHVQPENGEYMIKLTKYDFIYHAHVKVGEADPTQLHRQQVGIVGFLVRKLLEDLENPTKILVFRQNEPLSANDLTDLRLALGRFGPTVLLWVQAARPGYPPGSVAVVDNRLMVGHVTRLATRENAPDFDLQSGLTMLRRAHALCSSAETTGQVAVPQRSRTALAFGTEGNAAAHLGYGWSAPEPGFTWSVDDRSMLRLPHSGDVTDCWLEFDVVPFVAPPVLPSQSLVVIVNGEKVHQFNALERGTVGCAIPPRLVAGQAVIEIIFYHPQAMSPRAAAGEADDRRLAIAFRSLSLLA